MMNDIRREVRFGRLAVAAGIAVLTAGSAAADAIDRALASRAGAFDGQSLNAFAFEKTYAEIVEADLAAEKAWTDLVSPEAIAARRRSVTERTLAAIGGLPEKTPLNVRSYGRVARRGFTIEKLLFESRPKHYVTAHLFLPDSPSFSPPYPGVVVTCGHSDLGKLKPNYQNAPALLARAGFAALVYDPVDQGERQQLPGTKLVSVGGHSNAGLRAHLLGWSTAQFRLWDGIRAHDVLLSRPEVDPERTAVTGMSGGGTLSAYLNALDGRFRAAAPMGYLTSMRALASHCGPQDAEQLIFGQLAFGFNHLSLMVLNGRSAILPGFSWGDFFPYEGSMATLSRAREVLAREGRGEQIDYFACAGQHNWYQSQKRALIGWFRRHLAGEKSAWPVDPAALRRLDAGFYHSRSEKGLAECPDGEVLNGKGVMSLPGARSVYDLMAEELTRLEAARPKKLTRDAVRAACGLKEPTFVVLDERTSETKTYRVKKAYLEQPDGFGVFVTAFLPKTATGEPVMIASDTPNPVSLAPRVRDCLNRGCPVAVAEARAFGPTGSCFGTPRKTYWAGKGQDQEIAAFYAWLGKNLSVCRAEDYLSAGRWFRDLTGRSAALQAEGGAVVAAVHAYYFGKDRFGSCAVKSAPLSWTELVRRPTAPLPRFSDLVYGALKTYDWPDLLSAESSVR